MAKAFQVSAKVSIGGKTVDNVKVQVITSFSKPTSSEVKNAIVAAFPGQNVGTVFSYAVV